MTFSRAPTRSRSALVLIALLSSGCAELSAFLPDSADHGAQPEPPPRAEVVSVEKVDLFRRAETERARELNLRIERLQDDLRRAEESLIQAESGLAGSHTRADAVSSLAVARIQVERAASRAPWRRDSIEAARAKLDEAENQVSQGHFGAVLFFAYRAQRIAESLFEEADLVERSGDALIIHARRVNLRAGPSTESAVLSVLEAGTPVFPRTRQGQWLLMQVSSGPTGWVHRSLVGRPSIGDDSVPAAPKP